MPQARLIKSIIETIIDTETTDALRNLQRRQGLKVDGMLKPGGETEKTLNALLSAADMRSSIGSQAT